MRYLVCAVVVIAVASGPAVAGEIQFKPIDSEKLLIKPSKTIAAVTAQTIGMAGNTAAGAVEGNGYVKTINNLFGFRKYIAPPTQPGKSGLPAPSVFQSTQYKSYNAPMAPTLAPRR
jgi:hypothetical protein